MTTANLTAQDRADVACQLERVENLDGEFQSTEYLSLQQLVLSLLSLPWHTR